jgi:hypothetical protein
MFFFKDDVPRRDEAELSESSDAFSKPSSSASLDQPELTFSRQNSIEEQEDTPPSNHRLVSVSHGSNIRTHQRSLSASSIPVSFVSSNRPDSGFTTYPRPKSTSRRRTRSVSAVAVSVKRLGPNHLRSYSVDSELAMLVSYSN